MKWMCAHCLPSTREEPSWNYDQQGNVQSIMGDVHCDLSVHSHDNKSLTTYVCAGARGPRSNSERVVQQYSTMICPNYHDAFRARWTLLTEHISNSNVSSRDKVPKVFDESVGQLALRASGRSFCYAEPLCYRCSTLLRNSMGEKEACKSRAGPLLAEDFRSAMAVPQICAKHFESKKKVWNS